MTSRIRSSITMKATASSRFSRGRSGAVFMACHALSLCVAANTAHARAEGYAVARGSQIIEPHAFAAFCQDLHRLGSIHSIRRARSAT
jgi:hypothetical protein